MSGLPAARKGGSAEGGGLIVDGSRDVLVNSRPGARVSDPTQCGEPTVRRFNSVLFDNQPVSRLTDETLYGGPLTSGVFNMLAGTQGGMVGSVCLGGQSNMGSLVNQQLGAKVLLGDEELDFALPGPMPVVWQRQYSSYVNAEHGAACGLLGHGWHLPAELSLELWSNAVVLFDAAGRAITFEEGMQPGQAQYSRSEGIHLLRGGRNDAGELPLWRRQPRFEHVSEELAGDENCIIAVGGTAQVLWVFSPVSMEPVRTIGRAANKAADKKALDKPPEPSLTPGQRWRLAAQIDRYGRIQSYQYSQAQAGKTHRHNSTALPEGKLIAVTDGAERYYRLNHQRIHPSKAPMGLWGQDDGWRLVSVELAHDPLYRLPAPITLVRYGYNQQGQLITVHDKGGALVRQFEWIRWRISAHRYRCGPWHRCRYQGTEPDVRVAFNSNEEGLDYTFQYRQEQPTPEGKPRNSTIVTDSLQRVNVYRYESVAGLDRLVEHQRADGSIMRYQYDDFGRLIGTIDPLGRTSHMARDGEGNVISTTQQPGDRAHPAGLRSSREYDDAGYVTKSEDVAGAVTQYRYDPYKRLSEVTLPDGGIERYHYPNPKELPLICDNPIGLTDALGGERQFAYNDAGQLIRFTDCSGQTTEWDYDRWGQVIAVTDALGNVTRHKRDETGRIIETQLPDCKDGSQIRRYQYDAQGNLIRVEPDQDAPGSAMEIKRDLWGRPIAIAQGGLSVKMEWDKAGRLTGIINENGSRSWFVWDEMDRLKQEVGFDGRVHRYGYDKAGQLGVSGDGTGAEQTDRVTRYVHDAFGRLVARQIPAVGACPAQSYRYEWDAAGRLSTASVYRNIVLPQSQPHWQLQSRVEIERDKMGRVTAETQRLYRMPEAPGGKPTVEYEHRIEHQLDVLGNRQHSQLQEFGGVQWLRYGSGHVRSLMHDGAPLIDFERDGLHRETARTLHGARELTLTRWRDNLGRLEGMRLKGLASRSLTRISQALMSQLETRHYRYDSLSQLTAIEMPDRVLSYGYDGAGRLRSQALYDPEEYLRAPTGLARARQGRQWDVDPAGNRIPSKLTDERQRRQDWAEQVHLRWRDSQSNQPWQDSKDSNRQNKGPCDKWENNRIGFYKDHAWRYDLVGNRIEQLCMKQDSEGRYQRQRYGYDGANQLTDVEVSSIVGRGQVAGTAKCHYVHDALGRRLKKSLKDEEGKRSVTYFGWDGDQLVHTETRKEDGTRELVHILYEPGTFTPLARLSATTGGGKRPEPGLIGQSQQAMRELGSDPQAWRMEMGKATEGEKKSGEIVTVHFFHCDHIGTPVALTDTDGNVAWAARLDPWGNVEEEYNPHNIGQNLRLPGQYHDRETNLYYNRHRYYDPKIGAYVNQDPIGLQGNINLSAYVRNPLKFIDPLGLKQCKGARILQETNTLLRNAADLIRIHLSRITVKPE